MAERSSDLRGDVAVLRRRWRIIMVAVVLGVGLGILHVSLVPVQLTSRSLVLLSNGGSSSSDGGDPAVDTQVQIVLSTPVLDKAAAAMHPALSATQVRQRVDVQPVTSQLLQIDASSPDAREAQALSQAVADAYVQALTNNVRTVTGAIVKDLRARQGALTQRIKDLQGQLNPIGARLAAEDSKSATGIRDAQLKAQLLAEQANVGVQLDKVKSELAASGAVGSASTLASIIQQATPAAGPGPLPGLLTWGLLGAILCGAVAAALVALRERRDPRLRARDDMADAVGSSVLADVRSRRQRSVAEWSALFETYVAPPVDAWAFRQLLRALVAMTDPQQSGQSGTRAGRLEHPRSIAVVAVAGDARGLTIGPQLAAFAASLGITTRFVLATGRDASASLWAACSAERAAELRPGLRLEVRADGGAPLESVPASADRSFDELLGGRVDRRAYQDTDAAKRDLQIDGPDGLVSTLEGLVSALDAALNSQAHFGDEDEDGEPNEDAEPAEAHEPAEAREPAEDGTTEPAGPVELPETAAPSLPKGDVEQVFAAPRRADGPPTLHSLPRHPAADLTIVLALVDPDEPSLDGVQSTEVTVLALAPGISSREQLAQLAVAVDDAGRRIDGLVVADPDPADRTTGRRTLDERARQAPLPLRVTGIGQGPVAVNKRGISR